MLYKPKLQNGKIKIHRIGYNHEVYALGYRAYI